MECIHSTTQIANTPKRQDSQTCGTINPTKALYKTQECRYNNLFFTASNLFPKRQNSQICVTPPKLCTKAQECGYNNLFFTASNLFRGEMHEVGDKDAEYTAEVVDEGEVQVIPIVLGFVPDWREGGGDEMEDVYSCKITNGKKMH
jgi:hypothetical protein